MSITEMAIKIFGGVLAFIGFCLLLSLVNIPLFGIGFKEWGAIGEFLAGIVFLGLGILIVRGGRPTV